MPSPRRQMAGAALTALAGLGMLGGGVFEVVVQRTGAPAMARIASCEEHAGRSHNVSCNGTWSSGDLVLGNGRVVVGLVDGATENDIGQTLPVHVAGERAYVSSLRIPLILLAFGVAFLGYAASLVREPKR